MENIISRFLFTPRMRDGAVVVANDLTHLFSYQSRTALTSATIPDVLDEAKNHEHDTGQAEHTILEGSGFSLDSKEIQGRGSGWDATDLHPLPVARDSSTLMKDLRQKKFWPTLINTPLLCR